MPVAAGWYQEGISLLAHVAIVVICASGVAFLTYFEIAMIRELRGKPRQWKMVSRLRIDNPQADNVLVFPQPDRHRKRPKSAG